ncbi:pilus assembly protein TadG-related protein [Pseudarthrobacter sp902506025]|uniref:pilus assembly protein TadG-related protein n=1 Tax=Pseudarthrobacter sp. 902506025 TaxID=3155291 RepID=UPI0034507E50
MRWLGTKKSEQGVVAPMTALIMVFLLGMAALAVDVATMYSEHAQLQNGADSSALAIAQACAATPPGPACAAPVATAGNLANDNALDGSSNVITATVGAGVVDVTTQSRDASGNNHFSLIFARALGIQTADIRASAQATFGGISAANVVPLAFSKCESDPGFTKSLQFFPTHGSTLADDPNYGCKQPASGWELPGGFGWLDDSGTPDCSLYVAVAQPWIKSNNGNDFDDACATTFSKWQADLTAGKTVEVLLPIFDMACPDKGGKGIDPCTASPFGKNGKAFHIEAFAQVSLRGWHLLGGGPTYYTTEASNLSATLKLKNSDTGLFGKFIKKVSLAEAAAMGGPTTYGATGAALSK